MPVCVVSSAASSRVLMSERTSYCLRKRKKSYKDSVMTLLLHTSRSTSG